MDQRKIIYYENEQEDEFSLAKITPKKIDGDFVYYKNTAWRRFTHFFWYRMVAMPIARLYMRWKFHHKLVGEEAITSLSPHGYFLFGNHTQDIGDAFLPNLIDKKRDKYFIVHPNNVSMPVIGPITPSLGALPLPDTLCAQKNFLCALEKRVREGSGIVVYPEAHIWPYYTGIRPFSDTSFALPIRFGVPVFCFTNTYQKKKRGKEPKIVTYIDGPFYPEKGLSLREQRKKLAKQVYLCMRERAKNSNINVIQYRKKGVPE